MASRGPARKANRRCGTWLAWGHSVIESDDPAELGELGPEQGGGPPPGTPWTLVVRNENWSADLEHAAPLPRVGERIEYIGADGARRIFRVEEVVHTLQASATHRPPVRDEQRGPNTIVNDGPIVEPPRELRAGLPRVVVSGEAAPEG